MSEWYLPPEETGPVSVKPISSGDSLEAPKPVASPRVEISQTTDLHEDDEPDRGPWMRKPLSDKLVAVGPARPIPGSVPDGEAGQITEPIARVAPRSVVHERTGGRPEVGDSALLDKLYGAEDEDHSADLGAEKPIPSVVETSNDKAEETEPRPRISVATKLSFGAANLINRATSTTVEAINNKIEKLPRPVKVILGATAVAGIVGFIAYKSGAMDALMGNLPQGTTGGGHHEAVTSLGHKSIPETTTTLESPKTETVIVHEAAPVSKAARHISAGEGWLQTLDEMGVSDKKAHALLANHHVREALIKSGDAYVMPGSHDLGLNMTKSHHLHQSSIDAIQHAAGMDEKVEHVPVHDAEVPAEHHDVAKKHHEAPAAIPTTDTTGETMTEIAEDAGLVLGAVALGGVLAVGIHLGTNKARERRATNAADQGEFWGHDSGYHDERVGLDDLFEASDERIAAEKTLTKVLQENLDKAYTPQEVLELLRKCTSAVEKNGGSPKLFAEIGITDELFTEDGPGHMTLDEKGANAVRLRLHRFLDNQLADALV